MKNIFLLFPALLFSLAGTAQSYGPSDFYGIITFEENKTIAYDYLNNPDLGTNISWFGNIPSAAAYSKDMKKQLLPFSRIRKMEFMEFTAEDSALLKKRCPDCLLRKVKITAAGSGLDFSGPVFLPLKRLDWNSKAMNDLDKTRSVEARFLEEVTINLRHK